MNEWFFRTSRITSLDNLSPNPFVERFIYNVEYVASFDNEFGDVYFDSYIEKLNSIFDSLALTDI